MQRIPVKYIVQIDNFRVADFIFYWNYYEQPCSLLLQKPKTEGLTAIKMVVDSDEAASFLLRARRRRGAGCIKWINQKQYRKESNENTNYILRR